MNGTPVNGPAGSPAAMAALAWSYILVTTALIGAIAGLDARHRRLEQFLRRDLPLAHELGKPKRIVLFVLSLLKHHGLSLGRCATAAARASAC